MSSKPRIRKCRPDGPFGGEWSVYYGVYRIRGSLGRTPMSAWRDYMLQVQFCGPVAADMY